MTIDVQSAASLCLLALSGLAFWDGIVVHLVQERLPCRQRSRLEHGIHTARAILFPLILITFFVSGTHVGVGLGLIAVDQIAEIWDMAVERRSRGHTGGLRSSEYVLHGFMITLRSAGIAFQLAARASTVAVPALLPTSMVATWLVPGSVLVAALHVALLVLPACRARLVPGGVP